MTSTLRIALVGGGTGGHAYPLISVMDELEVIAGKGEQKLSFHYFGAADAYAKLFIERGCRFHAIHTGKLRRYMAIENFIDIPKFFAGLIEAFIKMFVLMPDALFSKGGPGALPVVWAAWFYRIPVIIHESDAVPGLTTLLSAPFAKRIGVSFSGSMKYFNARKSFLTGNPIRKALREFQMDGGAAKEALGFLPDRPLILFMGGSQGALVLNEFVELHLKKLLGVGQILHQTGREHFLAMKKLSEAVLLDESVEMAKASRYLPVAYFEKDEIAKAFVAADVVVSRTGSASIFEIAFFGKPSILVPLETAAQDHQRTNAYAYAETGAAVVVEEANLHEVIIVSELKKIVDDPVSAARMAFAAKAFAKPDAARAIAEEVLQQAGIEKSQ